MRRDLKSSVDAALSLAAADYAATTEGDAVDCRGYDGVMAVVSSGAITGAGLYVVKLQHGDVADGSDATDVAAADLQGSFAASVADSAVERVGYIGSKRYVRAVITKTSGTSVFAAVTIIRGKASVEPLA